MFRRRRFCVEKLYTTFFVLVCVMFVCQKCRPRKTNFYTDYTQKYNDGHAGCLVALIGIFSSPAEIIKEERFRSWLPLNRSCGLRFVFVRGRGQSTNHDTVHLDVDENMNRGKSLAWFSWASRQEPLPRYIFKMDMDTAICPGQLLSLLMSLDDEEYIGYPWRQKGGQLSGNICSPPLCPKDDWLYMSGGFYGLRTSLATEVAKSIVKEGHEDAIVGSAVHALRGPVATYNIECLHDCRFVSGRDCSSVCPVLHFMNDKERASKSSICVARP